MPRYIDADKKLHIQVYDDMHEEYITIEKTIAECLDCYSDEGCPEAADVEEVKHGKWIKDGGQYVCSECGFAKPYDSEEIAHGEVKFYWRCDFCRVCGTKMDEEDNAADKTVLCKDCKYLDIEAGGYATCAKAYRGIVAPNDSCSHGERK